MWTARGWSAWALTAVAAALLAACGGGGASTGTTTELSSTVPNIIQSLPLAVSDACPSGGVHIDWGVDLNGNHVLDTDEITGSGDICNGTDAPTNILLLRTVAATVQQCPSGGVIVEAGLDANGNGVRRWRGQLQPHRAGLQRPDGREWDGRHADQRQHRPVHR